MDLTDLRNGLTLADLLTVFGSAIVVSIVVQLIKQTANWSAEFTKRFAPITSCIAGMLLSGAASIYLGGDIPQAVLTGFLGGALSCGLYDVAASQVFAALGRLASARGATG
jgi:hypothetical protein